VTDSSTSNESFSSTAIIPSWVEDRFFWLLLLLLFMPMACLLTTQGSQGGDQRIKRGTQVRTNVSRREEVGAV
jgi:hypothetical protein